MSRKRLKPSYTTRRRYDEGNCIPQDSQSKIPKRSNRAFLTHGRPRYPKDRTITLLTSIFRLKIHAVNIEPAYDYIRKFSKKLGTATRFSHNVFPL